MRSGRDMELSAVVSNRNHVDIFCRLSTMHERFRQTNRPRNGNIDSNRRNSFSCSDVALFTLSCSMSSTALYDAEGVVAEDCDVETSSAWNLMVTSRSSTSQASTSINTTRPTRPYRYLYLDDSFLDACVHYICTTLRRVAYSRLKKKQKNW